MPARLTGYLDAAENIAYNIVGGFLTIVFVWLFAKSAKNFRRRRFRNIFGASADTYHLVFGSFELNPALGPPELAARRFYLVKPDQSGIAFSAEHVASSCEIRAASYIASALGADGDLFSKFVDDESLKSALDVDFISFGAMSNKKTLDVFSNAANNLTLFDLQKRYFVWKGNGQPIFSFKPDFDYGIILKIHPTQFPYRTWIACAGLGEWGTSGSAWFLSRKWRELESKVKCGKQFVAVVEVEPQKDESATLVMISENPQS